MKKIVIIGANSSLARNYRYFLERDKDVELFLFDRQDSCFDYTKHTYKRINFLDLTEVKKINFDCDSVFIFSGKTGATNGFEDVSSFIDVNERLLLNILNAIVQQGCKCRVIYPSSRLVYDDKKDGPLEEESPLFPKSIYAVQKIAAESYIKAFSHVFGLKYTIFRIAIPFGKLNPNSDAYGIVANFVSQAKNNLELAIYGIGDSVRTFTHIEDLCHVLWEGSMNTEMENDVFNIGGWTYSLYELATSISKKYGARIKNVDWPERERKVEVTNGWLNSCKLDAILHMQYQHIDI